MKLVAVKIVPKLLNFKQKQRHMDTAPEMLTTFNGDPDLLKLVTNYGCMAMTNHMRKGHNEYQRPFIPMAASRRAVTEKSTPSLVKCKDFAHCFLRLQWCGASQILATRSYGQ